MCPDLHCVRMALASCWKTLMEGWKQESREVAGAEEKMKGDEGWGPTDGSRDTQVISPWISQVETTGLSVRQAFENGRGPSIDRDRGA